MDKRPFFALGLVVALAGCSTPPPMHPQLRLLQVGDHWVYRRREGVGLVLLSDSPLHVKIERAQEQPKGRVLTVRLAWKEDITERRPHPNNPTKTYSVKIGERDAWQVQRYFQRADGALWCLGIDDNSLSPGGSGTTPDDADNDVSLLWLPLPATLVSGTSTTDVRPPLPPNRRITNPHLTFKVGSPELQSTKRARFSAYSVSGTLTQDVGPAERTWTTQFTDWYDGNTLLIRREWTTDVGHKVLNASLNISGDWELLSFEPARR